MSAPLGNVVQCGVFMVAHLTAIYPIMYSGSNSDLGIPNDFDNYHIVYPGWKLGVQGAGEAVFYCDNTYGTTPLRYNSPTPNSASWWYIFYMGVPINLTYGAPIYY